MATQPQQVPESISTETVSYKAAGLGPKFAKMVMQRQEVSDEIKSLESKKNDLNDAILLDVAGSGFKSVMVDTYQVVIVDTTRSTLSKEKLLELGVLPSIIEAATVTSTSTFLRVTDTDKGKRTRQEKKAKVTPIKAAKNKAKSKGKR